MEKRMRIGMGRDEDVMDRDREGWTGKDRVDGNE